MMVQHEENHPSENSNTNDDSRVTNERTTNSPTTDNERPAKKSRICHPIWQYLTWSQDKTSITCNLCQQRYSHTTGISTIKGHFATYHEDEWTRIKQQQIVKSIEPYGKKDLEKLTHLNSSFFRWIVCDQQPFSIVEDEHFISFATTLNPRYKLPSRQIVSTKIQWIYERQRESLKTYFNHLDSKVALTTDVWTACNNQSYMSVTSHWIDEQWKMHCILLDLVPLHERHMGAVLANTIYTTVSEFGLGEKIIAITTDNAPNMKVFGQKFSQLLSEHHGNTSFHRVRCAAHILNLIVKDGLEEVEKSVTKARKFATAIRSSQVLFGELKKIFELKEHPFLVPEVDGGTRWNSTYIMIKKLCRIRDLTDILVASNPSLKDTYLEDEDWQELDTLVALLEPIYQATNLLSASNHPTFGDLRTVFLVIANVINEARKTQDQDDTAQIRVAKRMSLKLNKYWDEHKATFCEAAILDPNNKLLSFESEMEKRDACKTIRAIYKTYNTSKGKRYMSAQSSKSESSRDYFRQHLKRAYNVFMDGDDPLEEYLSSPIENVDILAYWEAKSKDTQWIPLCRMARDYLVVQATSVPSEQMFSTTKFTINPTRNRLDPEKVRATLCLKTWFAEGLIKEDFMKDEN